MENIKFNTLVKDFNAMVDLCTNYISKIDHEIKCIISSSFETDMLILKETNATDETIMKYYDYASSCIRKFFICSKALTVSSVDTYVKEVKELSNQNFKGVCLFVFLVTGCKYFARKVV